MSWLIELTRHFVEQLNLVFRGTSVASHEIQPLGCTNFGNGTSNWWLSTTPQRAISNISVERNSFLWLLSQRGFRENPWKSSATSHNGIFLCTCEKQLFSDLKLGKQSQAKEDRYNSGMGKMTLHICSMSVRVGHFFWTIGPLYNQVLPATKYYYRLQLACIALSQIVLLDWDAKYLPKANLFVGWYAFNGPCRIKLGVQSTNCKKVTFTAFAHIK